MHFNQSKSDSGIRSQVYSTANRPVERWSETDANDGNNIYQYSTVVLFMQAFSLCFMQSSVLEQVGRIPHLSRVGVCRFLHCKSRWEVEWKKEEIGFITLMTFELEDSECAVPGRQV